MFRTFALPALGALAWIGAAQAADPIKIGEINSYSALPAFTLPYRKGWQLALDEINQAGGVGGRQIEVISRDGGGKPAAALTVANELTAQDGVVMLMGGFFSNIGLVLSGFAAHAQVFYLAGEPLTDAMVWRDGNRYTFRLRPDNYEQAAILAAQAAKLPAKRWATIAPNYEYGQSAVRVFKRLLSAKRPDVRWIAEQWPPQGKIDAGAVASAIAQAKPDAILNVTFGADLVKLVREGGARGTFDGVSVVSFLTGEPEYLEPLRAEAPTGWIVTGYPWYAIDTPAHKAFLDAYQARYHEHPFMGSVVGYTEMKAAAAILARAGGTGSDSLVRAAEGLSLPSPFGDITLRALDHQSTLGTYVGTTAVKDGAGVMTGIAYEPSQDFMPTDAEVRAMRPQG